MRSNRLVHRITVAAGGTALIAMIGLTAGETIIEARRLLNCWIAADD